MKFNNKPRKEQIFILCMCMAALCVCMLLLGSCSGSCFGCSYGCESGEKFHLGGLSYVSEGCCASSSCKTAIGTIDTNNEDAKLSDMMLASCTQSASNCGGSSSCYTGCFIGKDVDCGDWGLTCGTINNGEINENTIGCIDNCVGTENSRTGEMSWIFQLVYELLGI